jgi:transposase-like protein
MAKSERKPEPTIGDLAMLVARLVRQVRRLEPDNDVAEKAMCYLRRHNLQGSILRETNQSMTVRFWTLYAA